MKTKDFVIIGIVAIASASAIFVLLAYNQEIKLATGLIKEEDSLISVIEDPLCFPVQNSTSGKLCYPLKEIEEFGCSRPILEHLARYSTLLDDNIDGMFIIEWIGLPEGMSEKMLDECIAFIHEQRTGSKIGLDEIDRIKHPLNNYTGKDCDLEILHKNCFIDAFMRCKDARISKTETSIEGDPIMTHAFVNSTNPGICRIDVYRDTTQDRYSQQTIDHYVCSLIIESGSSIQITKCVPLEHDQGQRFEFE